MTPERLLNMTIKFYTSPKNFVTPKQICGYAPDQADIQGIITKWFSWVGMPLTTASNNYRDVTHGCHCQGRSQGEGLEVEWAQEVSREQRSTEARSICTRSAADKHIFQAV